MVYGKIFFIFVHFMELVNQNKVTLKLNTYIYKYLIYFFTLTTPKNSLVLAFQHYMHHKIIKLLLENTKKKESSNCI